MKRTRRMIRTTMSHLSAPWRSMRSRLRMAPATIEKYSATVIAESPSCTKRRGSTEVWLWMSTLRTSRGDSTWDAGISHRTRRQPHSGRGARSSETSMILTHTSSSRRECPWKLSQDINCTSPAPGPRRNTRDIQVTISWSGRSWRVQSGN